MSEEEKEVIDNLTMKAITSSAEAPDYPNCIVMKKDLITALNLIQKQDRELQQVLDDYQELGKDYHKLECESEQKDIEINKLNNAIDRMAEKINQSYFDEHNMWLWFEKEICPKKEDGKFDYKDIGTRKKRIKEYFMKQEQN